MIKALISKTAVNLWPSGGCLTAVKTLVKQKKDCEGTLVLYHPCFHTFIQCLIFVHMCVKIPRQINNTTQVVWPQLSKYIFHILYHTVYK